MNDSTNSPVCGILPPHMLDEIGKRGTPTQVKWVRRTQIATTLLTLQRLAVVPAALARESCADITREVYDAGYIEALPGHLVRGNGVAESQDVSVNEAYEGAGVTYEFYEAVYSRHSIDDAGMPLISIVHYMKSYDNAFWDGQRMVYGDGDEDMPQSERLFNRFTSSLDVIGHELTHGVTQYTANLVYAAQPGALNESISDVFGVLIKQFALGQSVKEADWLIGSELLSPNVKGKGLRSMKEPGMAYDDPVLGKDPQPATMKDFVVTAADNRGVHINSGIPNHAFYVTAYNLGGHARDKAGRIWYEALCTRLRANTSFSEAASILHAVAGEMYGEGSLEQQAVADGWGEVGIGIAPIAFH